MIPPIDVKHLTLHYDRSPALWDISFQVPHPLLLAIVGPNGAGKSSLIKGMLQLLPKTSGRVLFAGELMEEMRGQIAYIPQRESVDWNFPITVRELVVMGRYPRLPLFKSPRAADWRAADEMVERVGLTPYLQRQIGQLSGGQQQRAFLARALLQEALITLMDEPFTGIDQTTEALFLQILKEMRGAGKTVVVVHHNLEAVKKHFDWALLLNRCVISYGEVEEVLTPEKLSLAYGQSFSLLDQALSLSQEVK